MGNILLWAWCSDPEGWVKVLVTSEGKLIIDPEVTAALEADVGDASASTLGSLYGILGNPDTSIAALIAAITGAEPGYPVDSLHLLDHFNRKDGTPPDEDIWAVDGDEGYSIVIDTDLDGEPTVVELTTHTDNNDDAALNSNGAKGRVFSLNEDGITTVTQEMRAKLREITSISCLFGFSKLPQSGYTGSFLDGMAFRTDNASTWNCVTRNTNATITNTGIAIDGAYHKFKIEWKAASVTYYIDDEQVAQHTEVANFPTAALLASIALRTETTAARRLRIDYIKVEPT